MFTQRAIEMVADSKIKEAYEDGKFDRLPGLGKPFTFDGMTHDPNWWIKQKSKAERISELRSQNRKA